MGFSYLCLLLFMLSFIFYLIKRNSEVCPKKIKIVILIALGFLLLRYILLIAAVVIEKQNFIYTFKFLCFLNYFSIPTIVILLLFVFIRDNNVKFNINYIFMMFTIMFYLCVIIIDKVNIGIDVDFGFVLNLENYIVTVLIYLIILSSLSVVNLMLIDKPYNNKAGMRILLLSLIACLVEYILFLGGIGLFPYPIIGELFVLISLFKGITTFK